MPRAASLRPDQITVSLSFAPSDPLLRVGVSRGDFIQSSLTYEDARKVLMDMEMAEVDRQIAALRAHFQSGRITALEQGIRDFLAPYPLYGDPGSHRDECGEASGSNDCDCGATERRYDALKALVPE